MALKRIWIDADSCPARLRSIIIKAAERSGACAFFVANRKIPLSQSDYARMIIITEGDADSYILKKVRQQELVITRDIPLAARLLERDAVVINDRGQQFDSESIPEKLSLRNYSYQLRQNGIYQAEQSEYSERDVKNFAALFDKLLNRFYTS